MAVSAAKVDRHAEDTCGIKTNVRVPADGGHGAGWGAARKCKSTGSSKNKNQTPGDEEEGRAWGDAWRGPLTRV